LLFRQFPAIYHHFPFHGSAFSACFCVFRPFITNFPFSAYSHLPHGNFLVISGNFCGIFRAGFSSIKWFLGNCRTSDRSLFRQTLVIYILLFRPVFFVVSFFKMMTFFVICCKNNKRNSSENLSAYRFSVVFAR